MDPRSRPQAPFSKRMTTPGGERGALRPISTFVADCTGKEGDVGHTLESHTTRVSLYSFQHNGNTVHLLDTPGFNDTKRSEADVFKEIIFWLSTAHEKGIHLNGIVHLHSIAEPRWAASCHKSVAILKAICGVENYSSVVLATTQWGNVSPEIGNPRHQELSDSQDMWRPLKDAGAVVYYHSAGRSSAIKTVNHLMRLPKCILRVQKELEGPQKKLCETTAGRQIVELWGEELSANEQEMATQMKLYLGESDQEHAQSITELRQKVRKRQDYIGAAQVTREQLFDEWQAKSELQLRKTRQEIETNRQKIEEMGRAQKTRPLSPQVQRQTVELERLKFRNEELRRLQDHETAMRNSDISKKQMYIAGVSSSAAVVGAIAPLMSCVVM